MEPASSTGARRVRRIVFVHVGAPCPHPRPPRELAQAAAAFRAAGPRWTAVEDLRLRPWTPESATEDLLALAPDALLLWGDLHAACDLRALARRVTAARPRCAVAGAGPYPEGWATELCARGDVRAVITGADPNTVLEWIGHLEAGGEEPRGCRGLTWRRADGSSVTEDPRPLPTDLDALPAPAWGLLDLPRYRGRPRWAPLRTAASCAPDCAVCRRSFGWVFRSRSPAHVLAEVRTLRERHGVQHFVLEDELFNHDRARATAIAAGIGASGGRVELAHPLAPERVDAALARALREAGLRRCAVSLRGGRSRPALAAARAGVDALVAAGIAVHGRVALETGDGGRDAHRRLLAWAVAAPLAGVRFRLVGPGGTCARHAPAGESRVNEAEEAARILRRAYLRFYLRPKRWGTWLRAARG